MKNFDVHADFSCVEASLNPALHSSNAAPILSSRKVRNFDEEFRDMNFYSSRTHDWALWNNGQRMVDTYFVFPLMKLDANDPTNYYFKSTDAMIELCHRVGQKVFYRLGSSIEHSGDIHFNSLVPEDFNKFAEVCAGIVRHYREGWADGFFYDDMDYWEIWNEPDLGTNMWTGTRDEFISLYVTVLKRLKQEFPYIKVGGPALCGFNADYITQLLEECRKAEISPDFISWHCYGSDVEWMVESAQKGRKLLDELGFVNTETCIDEWHYVVSWDGIMFRQAAGLYKRAATGTAGVFGIDSGIFNLAVLAEWQKTSLNSAFYYGGQFDSILGFCGNDCVLNKNFYSMTLFGELLAQCRNRCASQTHRKTLYALAACSEDKATACLLVCDYRGQHSSIEIEIDGLEKADLVSCKVLDENRDNLPVPVQRHGNHVTLAKNTHGSAAYLLTFQIQNTLGTDAK